MTVEHLQPLLDAPRDLLTVVTRTGPTVDPRSCEIGTVDCAPEAEWRCPGDRDRGHRQEVGRPHDVAAVDGGGARGHRTVSVCDVHQELV